MDIRKIEAIFKKYGHDKVNRVIYDIVNSSNQYNIKFNEDGTYDIYI